MRQDEDPFTLSNAWANLRSWLQMLVGGFGEPAAIAARLFLRRADRKEILEWLAPLEDGLRRVLLMEALKRAKPNAPPESVLRAPAARQFPEPEERLGEESTAWRANFRVWPQASRGEEKYGPPRPRARVRSIMHFNAYPLARRVEAVIRVFEKPERYIAKIARRIHAEPAVTRAAFSPYRPTLRGAQMMLTPIQQQTELALETLDTS